jgi:hypothetical protein
MPRETTITINGHLPSDLGDVTRERLAYEQGYRQGYRDGHHTGWDIGHAHAHTQIAAEWAALAARIRGLARTPTQAELETRRWQGRREDFGKPRPGDYRGRRTIRGAA